MPQRVAAKGAGHIIVIAPASQPLGVNRERTDASGDAADKSLLFVPSSKANLGRPGQPTYRQGLGNLAVAQIDRAVSGATPKAGSHRAVKRVVRGKGRSERGKT